MSTENLPRYSIVTMDTEIFKQINKKHPELLPQELKECYIQIITV